MRKLAARVTLILVSVVMLLGIRLAAQSGGPQGTAPLPNPPINVNVVNAELPVSIGGTIGVKSVDEPGRSPYAAQFDWDDASDGCFLTGGNFQHCDFPGGFPVVPAGKRLVITNMSGLARAPAGCKVSTISLRTGNFGGTFTNTAHTFAVPHVSLAIPEVAVFNDRILAFVDAGSAPLFSVSASCAGVQAPSQVVTLAGYFVTLP